MRLILDMRMRYENGKLVFNSVIFFHMQLRLQKYRRKKRLYQKAKLTQELRVLTNLIAF